MRNSTIQAYDLAQMLEICALLVMKGIGFKADAGTLTITLTGAF